MANLKNQVHVYSLNTNFFMTDDERKIYDTILKLKLEYKGKIKFNAKPIQIIKSIKENDKYNEFKKISLKLKYSKMQREIFKMSDIDINTNDELLKKCFIENEAKVKKNINKKIKLLKNFLTEEFERNINIQRKITREIKPADRISMFESNLTRTLGVETNKETEDIIIIRVYHYDIFENIAKKGFMYNKKKYIMFSASAG